jgi:hypothetical protein
MSTIPPAGYGSFATNIAQRAEQTARTALEQLGVESTASFQAKAEQAAGLGEMNEDGAAEERDADGQLPWHRGARPGPSHDANVNENESEHPHRPSHDPTGQLGNHLDLQG